MDIQEILNTFNDDESIVEKLEPSMLASLSQKLCQGIENDRQSMAEYCRKYEDAIRLASMEDEKGDKTFPFVGASRVMSQMLVEAAIDFSSRAAPDIIGSRDICRVRINSIESSPEYKELELKSDRVSVAINNVLTMEVDNWRDSTDRELFILPIVGTTFHKTYYNGLETESVLVMPDKLIFDHKSEHFNKAPRKSFNVSLTRNEMLTKIRTGQFIIDEEDLDEQTESFDIMESHCLLDVDEDGYCEPYIAHVYVDQIVKLTPRFNADDVIEQDDKVVTIDGEDMFTQTIFMPDPFGSCMGLGWGILLSDTYKTINTNMRQMLDAGTLHNTSMNSGFIDSNSLSNPRGRTQKGKVEMIMGQFTSVASTSARPLRDSIVQFPFSGPSATLYQMMEGIKTEVRQLTSGKGNVEASPNEAAELYIARLQQGLKTPNAIMIRVYSGITKQLQRIYDIIYDYYTDEQYADLVGQDGITIENDFKIDSAMITTVADPSLGSEQERIAKASFVYQEAKQAPQLYNLREAAVRMFTAMGVPDIDQVIPEVDPNAVDPLAQMQQQYLQLQLQNEQLKAQTRLGELKLEQEKVNSSISKTKAEVVKILTEAAKNAEELQNTRLDEAQKVIGLMNQLSEVVTSDYQNAIGAMASGPGDERVVEDVTIYGAPPTQPNV